MANSGVAWANYLKKRMEEEEQRKAAESARARSALVNQWANAQAQRQKVLEAAQAAAKAQQERLAAQRPQQRAVQPAPSHGTVNILTAPAARQAGIQALPSHGTVNPITTPAARQTATQANQGKVYDRSADRDRLNEYAQAVQNARARLTGGLPTIRQLGSTTGTAKEMTPLTAQGRAKAEEIGKKQEDRQREALTRMQQRALELYGSANAPVPIGLVTTQKKTNYTPKDTSNMSYGAVRRYLDEYNKSLKDDKHSYDPTKPLDYVYEDDNTTNGYWLEKGLYDYGLEKMKPLMDRAGLSYNEDMLRQYYGTTAEERANYYSLEAIQGRKEEADREAQELQKRMEEMIQSVTQPGFHGFGEEGDGLDYKAFSQEYENFLSQPSFRENRGSEEFWNELDDMYIQYDRLRRESAKADADMIYAGAFESSNAMTEAAKAQADFAAKSQLDAGEYAKYPDVYDENGKYDEEASKVLKFWAKLQNEGDPTMGNVEENYETKGYSNLAYARRLEDDLHEAAWNRFSSYYAQKGKKAPDRVRNFSTEEIIQALESLGDREGAGKLREMQAQVKENAGEYREGAGERGNYVSDDQMGTMAYLISTAMETGDWSDAVKYMNLLEPQMGFEYTMGQIPEWQRYTQEHPVGAWITDQGLGLAEAVMSIPQMFEARDKGNMAVWGDKFEINWRKNTQEAQLKSDLTEWANGTSAGKWFNETVGKALGVDSGEVMNFIYDAFNSASENAIRDIPTIMGVPGWHAAGLLIMGSRTASEDLFNCLQNGYDPADAVRHALFTGAVEIATEKLPSDAATKGIKETNFLKYWVKMAIPETLEEGAGGLANKAYDTWDNDYHSEHNRAVTALMDEGMSREDAEAAVDKREYGEIIKEMASAGFSTLISAGMNQGAYKTAKQNAAQEQLDDLTPEQRISYQVMQQTKAQVEEIEAEIAATQREMTGTQTEEEREEKGRKAAELREREDALNAEMAALQEELRQAEAEEAESRRPGPQVDAAERRAGMIEEGQQEEQPTAPRRTQEQMREANEEDTTQQYPERAEKEATPTAPRRTAEQVQAANEEDTTQQFPERKEASGLTDEERAAMAAEATQERGEKGRKMADLRAREAEINEELARIQEERQASETGTGRRRTAEESAARLQGLHDRLDAAKAKLEMQMAEHDKRGKKITKLIRQATGAKVEMTKAAELMKEQAQKSAVSTGDLGDGKSIQNITKDGDIMASDGSVIDADQVDWEKMPDTKAVYDTAMRMRQEYKIAPATVFKSYQDGMKTSKFTDAVGSIASAGYLGSELTRVLKNNRTAAELPESLAKEIYLQAARAGEAYTQGRIKASRELRALKGSDNNIRFTKEAEELLKNEPEGSHLREEVALIRDLFKGSGLNFEFFASKADEKGNFKGEQGSINAEGTDIRIDLNAGKLNRNDAIKGAILQVVPHEVTHMIATRNPEGFKTLMKMVGDTLADQGKSLEKYAEAAKARYADSHDGAKMSQETAMEEAVAEASQMVLGDSQFAQKVAEKNPSLAQNIRDWLRNFARRIKEAFKNITVLNRVSMDMQNSMSEYAKAWDEALAGALGMDKGESKRTETAKGAKGTVYTSDNTAVSYHYELVNAFELTASNDYDTLKVNPYYPAELQPRDRSRQTSEDQINGIARNLNPGRLMDSSEASTGAPIVGPDYIVESGNGRTIALQRVIKEGGEAARRYNNELQAQAERFGLNPEDVKEGSVLVRVRDSEMNRNQRADFAKAANVSSTMASAAAESAESDAKKISGKTLDSYNPNGSAQGNADFYMRFLNEVVPENERNAMLTGNGQPTQALITRAENALFQRAYNNNELTQHMSERADPEAKNAVTAMMNVAARVASISDRIRGGALHDINFAGDIAAAAEQYVELKRTGQDVSDWLNQQSMFEQDDTMRAIVGLMEKHKRSATKLTAALNNMLDQVEAAGNPSQMSLLGDENLPTKGEIIERASAEEGMRFSDRGDELYSYEGRPLSDYYTNGAIYDYDFLTAQKDMKIVQVPNAEEIVKNINNISDYRKECNKQSEASLNSAAETKNGDMYGIRNTYTGRIMYAPANIAKHGMQDDGEGVNRIRTNGKNATKMGELIREAIPINGLTNTGRDIKGTYACIAYSQDSSGRKYVNVLTIEVRTNRVLSVEDVNQVHAVNGRIKREAPVSASTDAYSSPENAQARSQTASHTISIAQLLEIVNTTTRSILSDDVLMHLNGTTETNGYYTDKKLFSLRDFAQMSDREIVGEAMDLKDRTQVEKDYIKSYKNAYWTGRNLQDQITRNQQAMQRIGREDGKPMSQDYAAAYNRVNVLTEQLRRVEAALDEKEKNPLFRQLADGERARSEKLVDNMDDVMAQNERLTEKLTRYEQQLVRQKQRIAEYRRAGVNAAERTQLTKRITETAKSLGDMLATNTDKKHVPEALKKPLGDFLAKLNLYSRGMNEGGEGNFDDRLLSQLFARVRDVVADSQAMNSGQYDGELYMPEGFVEEMTKTVQRLEALETEYKNVDPLYKMDVESLRNLKDQLVALRWAINGINEMFANSRFKNVSDAANELYKDMMGMKEVGKAPERMKHLTKSLVTPVYFFDRLGSAGTSMFKGLREGYSLFAKRMAQIEDFADKNWGNKAANKWSTTVHEYVFEHDGVKTRINLTEAQIMTLYMYTKRAQAMNHVDNGGGIKAATITKDGKNIVSQATAAYLTRADIEKIAKDLTAEQKDVCAKVGEYMETLSGWGNEVSMARFGYRAFNEKNYFPIITSDTERSAMPETGARGSDLYKLLNMSFTKAINTNANNSLLIDDFFTVFANHAADMAKYSGMALPVLDTIRLLNYYDKDTKVNSREAMRHTYGTLAEDYLKTFLSDLSSATRSEERMGSNIVNGLIRNAKVASVAGNISVVLKQGISIARAGLVMPEVWLPHNMIREKQLIGYKKKYREMLEHSGIARWKSMSYYDMDTGRPLAERIAGRETWKDKFVEISGKGAELADNLTLINMWEIAKKRIGKQGLTEGSQEYWDAVTDLFEDSVYRTQVVDGIMNRSELMRSKSTWDKLATSFMAEPILTYNTFLHAVNQMRQEIRSGKKISGESMRLLTGATYAYLLNAFGESLISALVKSARDDDDYLTYWEKFWRAWLGEGDNIWEKITSSALVDGLNPLSWIPLFKTAIDAFNGENSTMNTVSLEYLKKTAEEAKKWAAYAADPENNEKPSVANSLFTTLRSVSYLSGLPLYNEARDLKSAWNTTMGEVNPNWKIQVKEPSAAEGYEEYYQAVLDGDTEKTERLTDRLKAHDRWDSTDKKTGEVTEGGAVFSKMRDYIKADFLGGGMDYETAEKLLKEIGGAEEQGDKSAYHYLHKWSYENETGGTYTMLTEMKLALKAGEGKGVQDAIKTLKDVYGVKEEKVPGKISDAVGQMYKAGEISRTDAEKMYRTYTEKTDLEIDRTLDKIDAGVDEDDDWTYYQSLFDLIDQGKDIQAEVKKSFPYSTKDQIKSAARSYIVKQYKEGKYDAATLEKKLSQYIEYSDAYGAYWAAQEIAYETANPDKSYHYIDSLVTAMDRGSGVQSEITRMMRHGKTKEGISSSLTSHYKPLWKAGNANTRAAIQQKMCAAWQAMGYTSKEIQTKLKNLQKNWAK